MNAPSKASVSVMSFRHALFQGQWEEFDKLVEEYRATTPDDPDLSSLFTAVYNSSLFAFRSVSTDPNVLKEQTLKRELKVLSVFKNPMQQLMLLGFDIEDVSQEHLTCLSPLSPSSPDFIQQRVKTLANDVLALLLERRQFEECAKLEELYHLRWEDSVERFYFSYKQKNARGRFICPNPSLTPQGFCLVGLKFSESTWAYLQSRGVPNTALPEVLNFIDACQKVLSELVSTPSFMDKSAVASCLAVLKESEDLCLNTFLTLETEQKRKNAGHTPQKRL